MEKILRVANSFDEADEITRQDNLRLTTQQRFEAFMTLMQPYYEVAGRLQRVYRVDDRRERKVRDDWGLRVQPVAESESDR